MHSLLIEPAWSFIDFGDDRVESEMSDAVSENAILRVKRFSLPGKEVDEVGNFITEFCAVGDDGCAFRLAVGNVADGAVGEEIVELSVRHVE